MMMMMMMMMMIIILDDDDDDDNDDDDEEDRGPFDVDDIPDVCIAEVPAVCAKIDPACAIALALAEPGAEPPVESDATRRDPLGDIGGRDCCGREIPRTRSGPPPPFIPLKVPPFISIEIEVPLTLPPLLLPTTPLPPLRGLSGDFLRSGSRIESRLVPRCGLYAPLPSIEYDEEDENDDEKLLPAFIAAFDAVDVMILFPPPPPPLPDTDAEVV